MASRQSQQTLRRSWASKSSPTTCSALLFNYRLTPQSTIVELASLILESCSRSQLDWMIRVSSPVAQLKLCVSSVRKRTHNEAGWLALCERQLKFGPKVLKGERSEQCFVQTTAKLVVEVCSKAKASSWDFARGNFGPKFEKKLQWNIQMTSWSCSISLEIGELKLTADQVQISLLILFCSGAKLLRKTRGGFRSFC